MNGEQQIPDTEPTPTGALAETYRAVPDTTPIPPTAPMTDTPLPPTARIRSKRWRLWVLLALSWVVIGLTFLTLAPWFIPLGKIRTRFEQQLTENFGRPSHIGSLHLVSILNPTLEATEVQIGDDPSFRQDQFLTVRKLRVQVAFSTLFGAEWHIKNAQLEGISLNLFHRLDGAWNWSTLTFVRNLNLNPVEKEPSPKEGATPAEPSKAHYSQGLTTHFLIEGENPTPAKTPLIEHLELRDSQFTIVAESPLVEETAEGNSPQPAPANDPNQPKTHTTTFRCEHVNGTGSLSKNRLICETLEAAIAGGRFQGRALVDFKQDTFDFEIKGDVREAQIADLLAGVSSTTYVTGTLVGNLNLKGQFSKQSSVGRTLEGDGHLEIRNGALPSVRVGEFPHKTTAEPTDSPSFPFPKFPVSLTHQEEESPTPTATKPEPKKEKAHPKDSPQNKPEKETESNQPTGGTKFSLLSCDFSLAPGKMETTKIECHTTDKTDVNGQGTLDFGEDQTTVAYQLSATMTPEMLAKLQKSRPLAAIISTALSKNKTVRLPVSVTGDIRHPKVEVDWSALLKEGTGDFLKKLPFPNKLPFPF